MKDAVAVILMLLGLPILGIYSYALIFGTGLEPNRTYEETYYRNGVQVTKTFHTVSAEKARRRTIGLVVIGAALFGGGFGMMMWLRPWSRR